jgi:hypothetical protein
LIIDFKKNKDKDNEIDIFLNLCDNVEKYLPEIIDKYYTILLKELYDEKLEVETLLELNELFNVLIIYDINIESKNNKMEEIKQENNEKIEDNQELIKENKEEGQENKNNEKEEIKIEKKEDNNSPIENQKVEEQNVKNE